MVKAFVVSIAGFILIGALFLSSGLSAEKRSTIYASVVEEPFTQALEEEGTTPEEIIAIETKSKTTELLEADLGKPAEDSESEQQTEEEKE